MLVVTDQIQYSVDDDTVESIRVNYPIEISDLFVNAYKESKTSEELETRLKNFEREADEHDRARLEHDPPPLPAYLGRLFD